MTMPRYDVMVGPTSRCVRREDGCLEWAGAPNNQGYGVLGYEGRKWLAHRLTWVLAREPIPTGMYVCHSCDNPLCCEIAHLFLGTQVDNMRDAATKGRTSNSRKTHCKHGHEFTPENTRFYRRRRGNNPLERVCLACKRDAHAREKRAA